LNGWSGSEELGMLPTYVYLIVRYPNTFSHLAVTHVRGEVVSIILQGDVTVSLVTVSASDHKVFDASFPDHFILYRHKGTYAYNCGCAYPLLLLLRQLPVHPLLQLS